MPIYILLGKVKTLLEWADGLLTKMLDWMGDTPKTIMTTKMIKHQQLSLIVMMLKTKVRLAKRPAIILF